MTHAAHDPRREHTHTLHIDPAIIVQELILAKQLIRPDPGVTLLVQTISSFRCSHPALRNP